MIYLGKLIYERFAPIISVIINVPWTDICHVLKFEDYIALVDFILDGAGLTLSLLSYKSLFYVNPKDESLLMFLKST